MESNRAELINLVQHDAVTQNSINDVVDLSNIIPTPKAWVAFINHLFLWIGCLSLGFSYIYFLAHNWSQIGRFAKFSIVEAGLVLSILVYVKARIGSIYSSAALTLSTILLGALMALFGQTYQTGADPWQLFFNWAVLMTPWALISRFNALWVVWLGLLNLSIILYCHAHSNPLSLLIGSKVSVLWLLFAFNVVSQVTWYKLSQSCLWMQKDWTIRLIALGVGIPITILALLVILDDRATDTFAIPVWLMFLAAFYLFYRKLHIDLFMLAGACLSGIVVIVTILAETMLQQGEPVVYLLLSVIVIGLGVGAAFWLKKVQKEAQL
jgi:uncharacterized membrane protein